MKKALIVVILALVAGCTSPEKVVVLDMRQNRDPIYGVPTGGSPDQMIRVEWKCPKCAKQYKTEYLAQKCIDSH